jgi:Zn-dependent protease
MLPFRCPYCNGYFCSSHRLPENHECPEIWRARAPREAAPRVTIESRTPYEYKVTFEPRPSAKTFWFSPTEIRHLTISALLVTAVGFSLVRFQFVGTDVLIGSALVFVSVFLLHEVAHKLTAQHFGLWAEFRLTLFGALLTLISIISPFKIISPGAVMIAGYADKEIVGKTAMAGPATNLLLSAVSFLSFVYLPDLPKSFSTIILLSAVFNAWIALFNLFPFGILDGWKVFNWDKKVWAIAFALSVVLTFLSYLTFMRF